MAMLDRIKGFLSPFMDRFDDAPLARSEDLVDFLHTRAAYVAQTALFGYLKTRMGTRYREIFQDAAFQAPLREAQTRAFLHCLADLVVFAVARIGPGSDDVRTAAAFELFRHAATEALGPGGQGVIEDASDSFKTRLSVTDWSAAAEGEAAFSQSPDGVIDAAPVIDGFREADRLIVVNSVRFRWTEIRRQFNRRIDPEALAAALFAGAGSSA